MNEDGHVSISRRGYLTAGLAVAVVGSMGVISTLNAGAEETATPPAAVIAAAPDAATPPPELPWGERPTALKRGRAGASSASLAAAGADAAPSDTGKHVLKPEYSPKGYTSTRRTLRKSRTTVAPLPPSLQAEPVPAKAREVKYHYASAYQFAESDGTYANLVIGKPELAKKDYHTLTEIAVQSADGSQIVEVGWTVDRSVNKDEDPHLFVYHWVDGQETCYNKCGFVPYSQTVLPGDTLPVGVNKRFGIQFYNGSWWIAYDSEWLGYFPGDLWDGKFTRSGLIQWFGEVAASSSDPCTDMGTGASADNTAAARAGTISLINGPEPAIQVRSSSPDREIPVYPSNKLSERTFRFGGTGSGDC